MANEPDGVGSFGTETLWGDAGGVRSIAIKAGNKAGCRTVHSDHRDLTRSSREGRSPPRALVSRQAVLPTPLTHGASPHERMTDNSGVAPD
jgi:hypothetical protein